MRSRPVYPAHSRHVAERVRPAQKGRKKRGRAGWQGAEVRPGTAEEALTTSRQLSAPTAGGEGEGGKRWARLGINRASIYEGQRQNAGRTKLAGGPCA